VNVIMADLDTVILHRPGGLNLTKRWSDGEMPIVPEGDWKTEGPQTIKLTTGFKVPLEVEVRKIGHRDGDVTGRFYIDLSGKNQWVELPLYAITEPSGFLKSFGDHIHSYANDWALEMGGTHLEAVRIIRSQRVCTHDILSSYADHSIVPMPGEECFAEGDLLQLWKM
jgi:hypothetical protein